MAQLTIHDVDDRLVTLLEKRAASRSRTSEEEVRHILETVLAEPEVERASLVEYLSSIPDVGDDEDFDRLHHHPGSADL